MLFPLVVSASAAQNVNYTVTIFSGVGTGSTTNMVTGSISKGQVLVHGNATTVYGYYVAIPPNTQSGYLIVAGYYPVRSTVTGSGWFTPSTYYLSRPTYYFSSNAPTVVSNESAVPDYFDGIVYVPAHTSTIYLVVYSGGASGRNGVYCASNSFINFIPDTGGADYSSILQQILTQLQNLKSEASNILGQVTSTPSQDQAAQAIVDQIEQTMQEIEELNQQIEDNTNRPPPDELLPTAPAELLPPSDGAAVVGYDAVSSILASPLMMSLLVMVFTLAFVRYVLFGKHDG